MIFGCHSIDMVSNMMSLFKIVAIYNSQLYACKYKQQ